MPLSRSSTRGRPTGIDRIDRFATAIGRRYMGVDRAEQVGRRNAVPGELLVRLRPEHVIAAADLAG